MTGNEHISQEDLALYALQALSDGECATVRGHLALCATCRGQFAEISGDTVLAGLSVAQKQLPVGARQRFLDRIAADAAATKQTRQKEMRARVIPIRRTHWAPWAIAAAFAILAVLLGFKNNSLHNQLRDVSNKVADLTEQSAQARRVNDLLTSRTAQRVLLTASKTPVEPTGRAVYLADSGSLIFQANNLRLLPSDKTYELWVIPVSGNPIPAGLFRPDAAGSASVVMPLIPKGIPAKAFGVTIEKIEGSNTPTAPIILAGVSISTPGE